MKPPRCCTFKQIIKAAIANKNLPPGSYNDIFEGAERIRYRPAEKDHLNKMNEKQSLQQTYQQKIAQLLGDTDKVVMEVYNHIILEKECAAEAIEKHFNTHKRTRYA